MGAGWCIKWLLSLYKAYAFRNVEDYQFLEIFGLISAFNPIWDLMDLLCLCQTLAVVSATVVELFDRTGNERQQ